MKNDKAKEKSLEAFNRMASTYDNSLYGKYTVRLHRSVINQINLGCNSALDLGCGTGQLLSRISKSGISLAGIDIAPEMIAISRQKLGEKADLRVGDVEKLPWENESFDVVLSTLSFHHYPDPMSVLKEATRVLKTGGRLIIGDVWLPAPLRQFIYGLVFPFSSEGDVRMYSRRQLIKLLNEAGLHMTTWELDKSMFFVFTALKVL
jgi:ubiquinone/menaquinone biosynthesis C-methylase UbiE